MDPIIIILIAMTALMVLREIRMYVVDRRKTMKLDWDEFEREIDKRLLDAIITRVHRDGYFTGDVRDYRYEWDGELEVRYKWS